MDASVRFASVNDFNQWSESYFRNPTPKHVPAALAFCEKKGLLNEVNFAQLTHSETSAVFKIAQIFRCHPAQVWEWAKACRDFEDRSLKGVMQALWLSQNSAGKQVPQKLQSRL